MIDMLVLRCSFFRDGLGNWPPFPLSDLSVPLEQSIGSDGEVHNTRHPWERIPSSYDSMAFKIFDHRNDALDSFYVEIKASPAKIMQGHNVYGSDDIVDCSMHLILLLYEAYPSLRDHLDQKSWSLSMIDITYSSRADSESNARCFVNALSNVRNGQTKARTGYDGTAYFGKKNSRLKKIKVYSKAPEVAHVMKKNLTRFDGFLANSVYTPDLLNYSKALIRWEASLFHRYFERMGLSVRLLDIFTCNTMSPQLLTKYWTIATNDLFTSLQGQTMTIINDDKMKETLRLKFSKVGKTGKISTVLADSAFRTYSDIRRDGWLVASESMSRMTFYRHVKMITSCGLSLAALQNFKGLSSGSNIIPFVRFISVDFDVQFPPNYQHPDSKYNLNDFLSLVA